MFNRNWFIIRHIAVKGQNEFNDELFSYVYTNNYTIVMILRDLEKRKNDVMITYQAFSHSAHPLANFDNVHILNCDCDDCKLIEQIKIDHFVNYDFTGGTK